MSEDTIDNRVSRLKRREAALERKLEQRARDRMTPSERQAAALGYPPPVETDDDKATPSEKQAAQMRRAVQ